MKKSIITAAILGLSFFNNSFASGIVNMKEKLQEVVVFENGTLPIEKNKSEFVKISFKINEEGKIEILEMNYSDEAVKTQLVEKLAKMKVEEIFNSEEIYYYNFTFKKI